MRDATKLWAARLIIPAALLGGVSYAAAMMLRQIPPREHKRQAVPSPRPLATTVHAKSAIARPSPRPTPTPSPAANPMAVKRVLDTGGPIRYGDWFWDDKGVPAGPVVITVDLKANVLSIFRAGYEIGTTAVIYGATDKETPLGVFPIMAKDAHHRSNLYGGAPMPYALRLTNDGIFIHGSEVAWDAATHGCIGVPTTFAKRLFAAAKVGDKVIITRGKTLDPGKPITGA